jgi:hydrogenase expression/formation protein HypC
MCLSIPAEILSIDGDRATVSVGGTTYHASLRLVDNVAVGDFVLLHSGYAIEKINQELAKETMALLKEISENI